TTHKELISLPGVGNKTANVFLIELFNENKMAVDTHVYRVVHRLGITDAKSVIETEKDLIKAFKTNLNELHQAFVLFGRYKCKAKNPECDECFVKKYCVSKEVFKAK
ncbi:MAG TPA: endonuclease III, partial [Nautiliaceae bacterium]|nr:endonuclease III [Nautiliaceae bacterium]